MRWLVISLLVALAGCSQGPDAAKQYEMVERGGGSAGELCKAGRRAADAYLADKNEALYREWKLRSDIHCLSAQMAQ